MGIKTRKQIPSTVGRRLLGQSIAVWNRLVAQGVIEVVVEENDRGSQQLTDFASLERAERKLLAG